jgi:hypothetical protein
MAKQRKKKKKSFVKKKLRRMREHAKAHAIDAKKNNK